MVADVVVVVGVVVEGVVVELGSTYQANAEESTAKIIVVGNGKPSSIFDKTSPSRSGATLIKHVQICPLFFSNSIVAIYWTNVDVLHCVGRFLIRRRIKLLRTRRPQPRPDNLRYGYR